MHQHKPIASMSKDRAWTDCITPDQCNAYPPRREAHGHTVRIDHCACGATRRSEINLHRTNYGPWMERDEDALCRNCGQLPMQARAIEVQ
jgi:hypothetical protein